MKKEKTKQMLKKSINNYCKICYQKRNHYLRKKQEEKLKTLYMKMMNMKMKNKKNYIQVYKKNQIWIK